MAKLLRSLRRTHQSLSNSNLFNTTIQNPSLSTSKLHPVSRITTRNCVSEMRKAAFEDNVLRLIRREIQYELDHFPSKQPATKFSSFIVDERPGEQWIRLKRRFGDSEEIKVEATMFDGSIPVSKSGGPGQDVELHISLIVNIHKGDGEVLEFLCSAWPDSIEITKLFVRENNRMPSKPYFGPEFKELDDELQDSLYDFLEERGIDEKLAVFLHEFMKNKGKTEFIIWMESVKSYIEEK
ncbi:hypothetical protein JRO89_XS09G0003200 [Xanthoceras sorbifolium]|uniref:Mitochondrial glycoprotein n=1 Tax=Xanthoceras sorbifolium TaxID=99658 RepID=A0ABQ8HK23_9ROSI|nr:hypothetical protein JRO89_XS09G0003200 [Xanthoceras sorbifolium]